MELPPLSRLKTRLDGVRVLIADDEILIALDIEATFVEAGAEVVGPSTTLAETMELAAGEIFAAAILDIRLGRETTEAVAELLSRRGIPFAFYSGQTLPREMRDRWPRSIVIAKPAHPQHLVEAAAMLLRAMSVTK